MKSSTRLVLIVSFLTLPFTGHSAEAASAPPRLQSGVDLRQDQNYSVIQRGPHHRVMAAVIWTTNATGRITARTNSYTELATGMNAFKDGKWVESSTEIEIVPGGAIARKGSHTVAFAADLSAPGAIDCITPDGKRLRSNIVGLGYRDTSTGNSVLIAELKSSVGELLPSGNQVLYPDAFTNLQADVLYSYTMAGLEQDVILREQPPSPSEFGFDARTTRLEVLTEFLDAPEPAISSSVIEPQHQPQPLAAGKAAVLGQRTQATDTPDSALTDETVSFGAMQLRRSKAFMVGSESSGPAGIAVGKSWQQMEGRSFLIEEVKYQKIQPHIEALPVRTAPSQAGDTLQGALLQVSPHRLLPGLKIAARSTNAMMLASSASLGRGFVLDYNLSGSLADFTFQSDTTYCVVGQVLLSGLTRIEGGSVVKFTADDVSLEIAGNGSIQCLTYPYRPVIFTAKDDDTVGTPIAGSTGVPTNYYGGIALDLSVVSRPAISNAHFSFLNNALAGTGIVLRDAQITCCHAGFAPPRSQPSLYNVLIYRVNTLVDVEEKDWAGDSLTAENVTAHYCTNLMADPTSTVGLTNCLFACVGGWQCAVTRTNSCLFLTSDADVFYSVGAGSHYLADQSPYRIAGTTNIDSTLLADLRKKTTYSPILYSNVTITTNIVLGPRAQRDTDTPDLGYHYDPIDYFSLRSCCVSNATVTLTNGVAMAYDAYCLALDNGARLVSCSTPLQMNHLVHYTLVQEQPVNLEAPDNISSASILSCGHRDRSRNPSVSLRFTTLVSAVGSSSVMNTGYGTADISTFDMQDCEVYGAGGYWMHSDSAGSVITLRNNLMQYANFQAAAAGQFHAYNNTFKATANYWIVFSNQGTNSYSQTDNAFDGCIVGLDGAIGHNAFLNGATNWSNNLQPTDIVTNLTWITGPLGNYYQPTNSPLIDAGTRTADLAGLYDYTTQTNQAQEANSVVDIGYHYAALDASGFPVDMDGYGTPNEWYLENGISPDTAGVATQDPDHDGLLNWQEYLWGSDPQAPEQFAVWVSSPCGSAGIP
jgi:hypothetical protein